MRSRPLSSYSSLARSPGGGRIRQQRLPGRRDTVTLGPAGCWHRLPLRSARCRSDGGGGAARLAGAIPAPSPSFLLPPRPRFGRKRKRAAGAAALPRGLPGRGGRRRGRAWPARCGAGGAAGRLAAARRAPREEAAEAPGPSGGEAATSTGLSQGAAINQLSVRKEAGRCPGQDSRSLGALRVLPTGRTARCGRRGRHTAGFLLVTPSLSVRPAEYSCQKRPPQLSKEEEEGPGAVCHRTPDKCLSLSVP